MPDGPTRPQTLLREGEIFDSKFRVDKILGTGGMGIVVRAVHVDLEKRVAIKFMLPEIAQDRQAVERFMREGRAAVRLRSEHVCRIHDVGRLASGEPYLVMEYLKGKDLSAVVAESGALPVTDAVDHVLQACEAIAEAHGAGIVHRDLKPSNLFLARDAFGAPCVKVLDFGISKMRQAASAAYASVALVTHTGAPLGSPMYMAPEQTRSARSADARTDVWALGSILYELLAGKPPWPGDNPYEVIGELLTREAPRVRELRPEVPEAVEAAIVQCLDKEPARRFQRVADLIEVLAPYGSERVRTAVKRVTAASQIGAAPAADEEQATTTKRPPSEKSASSVAVGSSSTSVVTRTGMHRHPMVIAASAGAALLLVGAAIASVMVVRHVAARRAAADLAAGSSVAAGPASAQAPAAEVPHVTPEQLAPVRDDAAAEQPDASAAATEPVAAGGPASERTARHSAGTKKGEGTAKTESSSTSAAAPPAPPSAPPPATGPAEAPPKTSPPAAKSKGPHTQPPVPLPEWDGGRY